MQLGHESWALKQSLSWEHRKLVQARTSATLEAIGEELLFGCVLIVDGLPLQSMQPFPLKVIMINFLL